MSRFKLDSRWTFRRGRAFLAKYQKRNEPAGTVHTLTTYEPGRNPSRTPGAFRPNFRGFSDDQKFERLHFLGQFTTAYPRPRESLAHGRRGPRPGGGQVRKSSYLRWK